MRPVYITVLQEETGKRIKKLMDDKCLNVRDIQTACGFEAPQAVYKWINGQSLPSIENMVILSVVLETPIDGILVRSGDASFFVSRGKLCVFTSQRQTYARLKKPVCI